MSGINSIIKSKKQYHEYCDKIMELNKLKTTAKIENEIELLSLLISKWDEEHGSKKNFDPIKLLKYLMENRDMNQTDLVEILGITKGAVSQIMNYKKGLSKDVIRKLSEVFKVSQEAFNRIYPLVTEVNKGHINEKMMNTKKEFHLDY